MEQFIYFLGRFHVLVLHLPVGVLMLAVGLEFLARRPRYVAADVHASIDAALPMIWGFGALTAVVTVAAGYMHATEPGFTGAAVNHHRWAGTALAFVAVLIWAWRGDAPRSFAKVWPIGMAAVVALLFLTGHLGGVLTHGPNYLTQFAPGAQSAARPKPTDVAQADIYLDVIGPLFSDKCVSCHNEQKRRGGLSLVDYAAVRKGGESGPVIEPGNPAGSELFRRVTLPPTDDEYMPENHKNPPTPAELEVLRWWIEIGAPGKGVVADLAPPETIRDRLRQVLGL